MEQEVLRRVEIQRQDDAQRIVYGEVMVPGPDIEPGQTIPQSELAGVHHDGLFLDAEAVEQLAHRVLAKRVSIDVRHDNEPIGAEIVESFVARDAGWGPWQPGAFVCGVKIYDDNVWKEVEDGKLTAYSIQFTLRVREVMVVVTDDAGENPIETRLLQGAEPNPSYLSLVAIPSIGEHFQVKRAALPYQKLPMVKPATAWNAAMAKARVRKWATNDDETVDLKKYGRAFVWVDSDRTDLIGSYKLPIADVVGDRLTAVPRAVLAAGAALMGARGGVKLPDGDVPGVKAHLARYYKVMRKTPPWETEEKDVDDKEKTKTADDLDATIDDKDGVMKRLVNWFRSAEPNLSDGSHVEADETRDDETGGAGDDDGAESDTKRAEFDEALADEAAEQAAWELGRGWRAYHRGLFKVLQSDDIEDKAAAVKAETEAFVAWLVPRAAAIFEDVETSESALSAEIDRMTVETERAGRKMSASRMKKLSELVDGLKSLLADLSDAAEDEDDKDREAEVEALKREVEEALASVNETATKTEEASELLRAATDEATDLKTKLDAANAEIEKYRNAPAARQSVEPQTPENQDVAPTRLCDLENSEDIARELGSNLAPTPKKIEGE